MVIIIFNNYLLKDKYETESVGIYSEENPLTKEKVINADLIIVIEEVTSLSRHFVPTFSDFFLNFPYIGIIQKRLILRIILQTFYLI